MKSQQNKNNKTKQNKTKQKTKTKNRQFMFVTNKHSLTDKYVHEVEFQIILMSETPLVRMPPCLL